MMRDYPRCTSKLRNDIRGLHTARARRSSGTFLVEGPHACEELASSGAIVECVVLRDNADLRSVSLAEVFATRGVQVLACGSRDMERMSDCTSPQDILAVAAIPPPQGTGNRLLILDALSDPGNLGTVIRSAAWFGFHDVLLLEGSADPFAPKVVRSSVGALLRTNIIRDMTVEQVLAVVGDTPLVAATLEGGQHPSSLREHTSCALVIGSEAHGVRPNLLTLCSHRVTIPGSGYVESLNAGIAAAILMYEAS